MFSRREIIFPVEISFLVDPKQISVISKTEKKKGKKKDPLLIFILFPFHFQFTSFPFIIFLLFFPHFSIFPCFSFPGRSPKISWWKMSGGTLPLCLLCHWLLPYWGQTNLLRFFGKKNYISCLSWWTVPLINSIERSKYFAWYWQS